ncbi:MAG: hypothetical protein AAGA99_25345 [Actinomycetota bacterium]
MNLTPRTRRIGIAGAALAGGSLLLVPAIAGAQEDDDTTTTETESESSRTSVLDELVEEGVITSDQADIIRERFEEARGERGFRGHRGGFSHGSETVTDLLGLTQEELREELAAGQTLAEVAEAQGVSVETLVDALVADAAEHLDEHVADGDLTEEEAAERLEELEERITDRVNGEAPERGEGFGRRGGFGRFGGFGGPGGPGGGDAEDAAATTA